VAPTPRRRRFRLRFVLISSAALTALVLARADHGSAAPNVDARTGGAMSLSNSLDGVPVFAVSGLSPGESTTGEVTIGNGGSVPGAMSLSAGNLLDAAGPNGGALSSRLRVRIDDVTARSNLAVYEGGFDGPANRRLPVLVPGDRRTYRFTATFPDGGTPLSEVSGDNIFQASSARVDYIWTLAAADAPACGNGFHGGAGRSRAVGTQAGDRILGHEGTDLLVGRHGADCLLGGLGADTIKGNAGEDRLRGAGGDDQLRGGGGRDRIFGGYGRDQLSGAEGNDRLRGNGGNDWLGGGGGRDHLHGGLGDDVLFARDGIQDFVRCGPGRDQAIVDHLDRVRGCEVVERPTSGKGGKA
jgi:Ca2+-binding RTX toxin-like protein